MQKWRLKYLATWRLDLAADYLRAGEMTIRQIAETTGYGSESALTRAFKVQRNYTGKVSHFVNDRSPEELVATT